MKEISDIFVTFARYWLLAGLAVYCVLLCSGAVRGAYLERSESEPSIGAARLRIVILSGKAILLWPRHVRSIWIKLRWQAKFKAEAFWRGDR